MGGAGRKGREREGTERKKRGRREEVHHLDDLRIGEGVEEEVNVVSQF